MKFIKKKTGMFCTSSLKLISFTGHIFYTVPNFNGKIYYSSEWLSIKRLHTKPFWLRGCIGFNCFSLVQGLLESLPWKGSIQMGRGVIHVFQVQVVMTQLQTTHVGNWHTSKHFALRVIFPFYFNFSFIYPEITTWRRIVS